MIVKYEEIHKEKIEFQIQARYAQELEELHTLGFSEVHHFREESKFIRDNN